MESAKVVKVSVIDRQKRFEDFTAKQSKILLTKGVDYTAGNAEVDAYANFRLIAKLLDGCPITPYTVALIYKLKHTFSLITFCKTGMQESGEDLEGRHLDEANYTFILNDLVLDHLNSLKEMIERERGGSEKEANPEKYPSHRPQE